MRPEYWLLIDMAHKMRASSNILLTFMIDLILFVFYQILCKQLGSQLDQVFNLQKKVEVNLSA
jgi:hypothetical protein